jgi:outer membrane immunogenic protein
MKKILLAGVSAAALATAPALAADLPTKAPVYKAPIVAAAPPMWTGCYIGGNTGGAWKSVKVSDPDGFVYVDKTFSGWVGGGQIGCDSQLNNNWVVGIQAMWDASGVKGNVTPASFSQSTINVKASSFGTVTASLGYLINPTLKFYGKVGYGWLAEKSTFDCPSGIDCDGTAISTINTPRSGFDAGLGLTWMFQRNWDLFIEYDHMWLGTKSATYDLSSGSFGLLPTNQRESFDKVLVGIDYRFDMGKAPVVAKY